MARVNVVCDASYDDRLKLTGYAGLIELKLDGKMPSTHSFGGVAGEFSDIHQGEIYAILSGLQILKDLLKYSDEPLHSLTIHTDSQVAIHEWHYALEKQDRAKDYINIIDRIVQIASQKEWPINIKHVKGHQQDSSAKMYERMHNLADQRARDYRIDALRHMTLPKLEHSPYYAIILPPFANNAQEATMWEFLAEHLTEQGQRARAFITEQGSQQSHPFITAISRTAERMGLPRNEIFHQLLYAPHHPIQGLDMTLARHHLLRHQKRYDLTLKNEPDLAKAAVASRLLLGESDSNPHITTSHCGRLTAACHVVYDLTGGDALNMDNPHSVEEWVQAFSNDLHIPVLTSAEHIIKHANLPHYLAKKLTETTVSVHNDLRIADCASRLKTQYEQYSPLIEKHQWADLWVNTLSERGFMRGSAFHDAMHRFIMITDTSDVNKLIEQTLKHAEKLSPPSPACHNDKKRAMRDITPFRSPKRH